MNNYSANAWGSSEAKIIAQRRCWSYANSLNSYNFIATHLWKNTFSSLFPAYWRYKPCFCFFSWQIKMSNLLHVGLILIINISRVFTILRLLCLCRNMEYCGNFQDKTEISKQLFCQMSAQVKWEGRPFWSGQEA